MDTTNFNGRWHAIKLSY